MERKTSEAQMRAKNKYDAKTYSQLCIRVKKTEIDALKERIKAHDTSINNFVLTAILEKLEKLEK